MQRINSRADHTRTTSSAHPPSVETILESPALAELIAACGRSIVADYVRAVIAEWRIRLRPGEPWPDVDELIAAVERKAEESFRRFPQRVVNATGVLLHTNLGRAPWDPALLTEMSPRLTSYVSLEYDVDKGERGRRGAAVEAELAALTGAEAALIVNNNAAAVYLALSALAWDREVVISRGELVQIGGGFRIPEILAKSGAVLHEVGTTNQTALADYEKACGQQTALILKVHRSNFVQTGFVAEVQPKDLAELSRRRGIPVLWDLGSGAVGPGMHCPYSGEPTLKAAVASGVDLVTASGDKLLGGPQAGILLGRADLLARLRSDPFCRALRAGKATLLMLERIVAAHRAGRAGTMIPLYRLLSVPDDALRHRADRLQSAAAKAGWIASVEPTQDTFGGGAAPGKTIPGWGLRLAPPPSAERISQMARAFEPPIVAAIADDGVVFSLRTMFSADDDDVIKFLDAPRPPR